MNKNFTFRWLHASLLFLLCVSIFSLSHAQVENTDPCNNSSRYLYWTGEENSDFFNEKNWRITNELPSVPVPAGGQPEKPSCLPGADSYLYAICANKPDLLKDMHPKIGALDPGVPISYNLLIESGKVTANGDIVFACSKKGITLVGSQLDIVQGTITQGVISLLNESTVHLRDGDLTGDVSLNFLDAASWVYTHVVNPDEMLQKLNHILVNHVTGSPDVNFRVNQYYQHGSVIRPMSDAFSAMNIFSATAQQGAHAELKEDIIYSGAALPGGMDNATHSFILKRGFMATLANNANGTGKSKVYIASEKDLVVNSLDPALQGNVSFIRVVPWNWVTKKGTGGFYNQLDAGWFYNWGLGSQSQPNYEYVPMAWGAGGALPASINQIIAKKRTTHVLGFNESDNCNDQSGKFNNLCQPAVAVAYYENLMGLGVRLGTPAPRENGPTTWLLEFTRIAKEKDVRFDFVAVHWYDWGSSPANSPNADPQQIFNRFKSYLENVYRIYQLPIWITEFNANPNRGNAIQHAFLELALPYLESLDYVERYAYFQPNPAYAQNPVTTANYLDENGGLTNIGELYKNQVSAPSIPEETLECANNLQGLDLPFVPKPVNSMVFEAECGKYLGSQWEIHEQGDASNGLYIQGNTSLAGATTLAKQVHYEFDLNEGGTYRVWIRSSSSGDAGALRIKMDGKEIEQMSPFTSNSFTWFQVPRFYDLGEGKHRLTIEFPNANIRLDQVVITNGQEYLEQYVREIGYCTPASNKWGLEATDIIAFYEAESAVKGASWNTETSANAVGGAFIASAGNVTSPEVPDGNDKVVSFNLTINQSDEYEIWAKIRASDPPATSLWISVDDEPFTKWNNLTNTTYEWYWKKFHYSYGAEDRNFTFFLPAGQHRVRIAIASGHVFVDRLAVVTKGKLPETIDPNVLLISENLEFEAETATLLGAAAVVNCATSSNGKQVNMFNQNANGIRFPEIVAETAGPYKLKISYMSAALRTFRIIVNGVTLGRQNPPVSGAWCFNNGRPGIHEVDVVLKRGINAIELTPFSGDAPFIDKIKLEKAPLTDFSFEAETAEQIGATTSVNCATASNLALINPGAGVNNGIRFKNLISEESKSYLVDIHYISKVNRNLNITLNDDAFNTQSFLATGNWCYEGGTTKVLTIALELHQGTNTLEFRSTGADAPFIDKIAFREADPQGLAAARTQHANGLLSNTLQEPSGFKAYTVYPNPVQSGSSFMLSLPEAFVDKGPVWVQITDLNGRIVYAQTLPGEPIRQVRISSNLSRGIYVLSVIQGQARNNQKILVK